MTKINNFIESTDYSTLRNDDDAQFTLTIPGSTNVSAGSHLTLTADKAVGSVAAASRVKMQTSRDLGNWYINARQFNRTGLSSGFPAPYTLYVNYYRVSSTVMRAEIGINNPYGDTLTTQSGDEVFTFDVRTMIMPFEDTA